MIDDATVAALQRHWEDGWNTGDLEVIMAPMAAGIVFSSPFVSRYTGDPNETEIRGYDALRAYVENALRRTPGISYKIHDTYIAPRSVILTYSFVRPDGSEKRGVDIIKVNDDNQMIEWISHYPYDFTPESL